MKVLLTAMILVSFNILAIAQSGRINIQQDEKITDLLALYKQVNSSADSYTIQIGFGSYSQAENLKLDADRDFPGWYSKIIFDSPTYRVQIGRFKTKLEAEREFLEVRKKYPAALILKPVNK